MPKDQTVGDEQLIALGRDYLELLQQVKDKLRVAASAQELYQLISLAPMSWSVAKVARELKVGERLVKNTRGAMEEQGILPIPKKNFAGNKMPDEHVKRVKEFAMPGA